MQYTTPQGTGTDGYALTPNGAQKLITILNEKFPRSHIDGWLVSHCIEQMQEGSPPMVEFINKLVKNRGSSNRQLNAACLAAPAILHSDFGYSSNFLFG